MRPYVLRNKTDRTDVKGLLEAFRNDEVRQAPVKSEIQHAARARILRRPQTARLTRRPH